MSEAPAIGSVWKARDGRVMRVDEHQGALVTAFGRRQAIVLTVLNAKAIHCRAHTVMDVTNFGNFLVPHEAKSAG